VCYTAKQTATIHKLHSPINLVSHAVGPPSG